MNINIANAKSLFFSSPSLEFVYFEAIANAIDAKASIINIDININSFIDSDSLEITIQDNGKGFVEENFKQFCELLSTKDESHKGVGRLVFLKYFDQVFFESNYKSKNCRKFVYNDDFNNDSDVLEHDGTLKDGTTLSFTKFNNDKVKKYSYLVPAKIKKSVQDHFFPLFYTMKMSNKELEININLKTSEDNKKYGFYSTSDHLKVSEIETLEEVEYSDPLLNMYETFKLRYSIKQDYDNPNITTAICVDGRTVPIEIVSKKSVPKIYSITFLLFSDFFQGKSNSSRESLALDDQEIKLIRKSLGKEISKILNERIPDIVKDNKKIKAKVNDKYPHLQGYFDTDHIGLIDKKDYIMLAQDRFFEDQRSILEADDLSDEQYERSLNISSRLLTEYILYRTKIIHKLKKVTDSDHESVIHDLIAPRRKCYSSNQLEHSIFTNNAWLLDDKYMSYSKIFSDVELSDIFSELGETAVDEDGRPDLTMIFSADPSSSKKVDVVLVELKRMGLKLAKKEEIVSQLKQRARRLMKLYPNKIQRIWFYGIIDFDDEFLTSMAEDGFVELYSDDKMYYKEQKIILDREQAISVTAGLHLLSFESFIKDAEDRNKTFLKLLKNSIKESSNEPMKSREIIVS